MYTTFGKPKSISQRNREEFSFSSTIAIYDQVLNLAKSSLKLSCKGWCCGTGNKAVACNAGILHCTGFSSHCSTSDLAPC